VVVPILDEGRLCLDHPTADLNEVSFVTCGFKGARFEDRNASSSGTLLVLSHGDSLPVPSLPRPREPWPRTEFTEV